MPTYAVIYAYTADSTARDEHRPAHKAFLEKLYKAGTVRASGPFGPDDDPGALIVLTADSVENAAAILEEDPFYARGLVARRDIRSWNIVFGGIR